MKGALSHRWPCAGGIRVKPVRAGVGKGALLLSFTRGRESLAPLVLALSKARGASCHRPQVVP